VSAIDVYRSWVEAITSLTVIYEDEGDPSVPRPNVDASADTYVMIGWDNDDAPGSPVDETTDEAAADNKVVRYTTVMAEGSLAVDIYGPGAMDYVRALRMSIYGDTTTALLLAAGDYVIRRAGPILPDPIMRDATREPHASCVFDVAWSEDTEADVEAAETAVATTTVTEE